MLRNAHLVFLALVLACPASAAETADRILSQGNVITVDPQKPRAEAIAIRDGKILAVGTNEEILALSGPTTVVEVLDGKTVLPGFIDAHGHFSMQAQMTFMRNIASAPVGAVRNIPDLQREMRAQVESPMTKATGWVIGFGYDDSLLAENRHPTREELDAVSRERPVVALHVSLHLAAANSKALELAGITADTEDPAGGIIRRKPGSREPDGVLEESAIRLLLEKLPTADGPQALLPLIAVQQTYARHGITTAQDGATDPAGLRTLQQAAKAGMLKIDVVAFPLWETAVDSIGDQPVGTYQNGLKIGGVKMILDGSPQGKTAFLTKPYEVAPPGLDPEYRGYPAMPDNDVAEYVAVFAEKGWPLLAHANGDAAADQLLAAVAAVAETRPEKDHRTVMIHAQTVREDQLDQMVELGMIPSFFVAHTFFWGDWHRDSVLGDERARKISPANTAGKKGLRYTFHNDSPVVPPDMMRLIWTGVNRKTRSGQTLGWQERVTPMEAIEAVTIDAARQHFDEATRGSIEPGKLADLVVLDQDPLTAPVDSLASIAVTETIKKGITVYPATPRTP